MESKLGTIKSIEKKIDKIALTMEKFKLVDYVYYLEHPRKMFLANFIGGLSRGFGIAVGFTLLGAVALYFLQIIVRWNIPLIGQFVSEIVKVVQEKLSSSGGNVAG